MASFKIPDFLSKKVMLLSAGFGKRLAPLTLTTPKPLLKINDIPLLDYHRHTFQNLGFEEVVINTHYLAHQIESHVQSIPILKHTISFEKEILDTGGGLAKVIDHFDKPFLSINADAFTTGPIEKVLQDFIQNFDAQKMQAFLLTAPKENVVGYQNVGDCFIDGQGHLNLRGEALSAPFVYQGIQILNPALFKEFSGAFSVLKIWAKAAVQKALFGYTEANYTWYDTGTPEGFAAANRSS